MSENEKAKENEVFDQHLSLDDLDAAAGGSFFQTADRDSENCTETEHRPIYGGKGFPNCAATVEDGSWCGTNDACRVDAIVYRDMGSCAKAWG